MGRVHVPTPTQDSDVATKLYVDTHSGGGGPIVTDSITPATPGGATTTGKLHVPTPTDNADAATKLYVDSHGGGSGGDIVTDSILPFTPGGATITGKLQVPTPTQNADAVTKLYVDTKGVGPVTTDSLTPVTPGGAIISGKLQVPTPTENADAATKLYVDTYFTPLTYTATTDVDDTNWGVTIGLPLGQCTVHLVKSCGIVSMYLAFVGGQDGTAGYVASLNAIIPDGFRPNALFTNGISGTCGALDGSPARVQTAAAFAVTSNGKVALFKGPLVDRANPDPAVNRFCCVNGVVLEVIFNTTFAV